MTAACVQRATQYIPFREEHLKAIESAARLAERSEAAWLLLQREAENIADPNGERRLLADEQALKELYGENWRLHTVLALLMRFDWLREMYRKHAIPDSVLTDTLRDLPIWMDVCRRRTGQWGLIRHRWLMNHFRFRLFRLGRLQFICQPCDISALSYVNSGGEIITLAPDGGWYTAAGEWAGTENGAGPDVWRAALSARDGGISGHPITHEGKARWEQIHLSMDEWRCILKPGDPVLDMHIAEGEPLSAKSIQESLSCAPAFFEKHFGITGLRAFTCTSWLLDWALPLILPDSNIAAFQRRFYCVPAAGGDNQTIERIFDGEFVNWKVVPQDTSLQRAVRVWYLSGQKCRAASGYIPILS